MGFINNYLEKKRMAEEDAERKVNIEIERINSKIAKGKIGDKDFLFKTIFFDKGSKYPYEYKLWKPCFGNFARLTRKELFSRKGNDVFIDKYRERQEQFFNQKFLEFGIDAYLTIAGQTVQIEFGDKDDFILFRKIFKEYSKNGLKEDLSIEKIQIEELPKLETDSNAVQESLPESRFFVYKPLVDSAPREVKSKSSTTASSKVATKISSNELGKQVSASFFTELPDWYRIKESPEKN